MLVLWFEMNFHDFIHKSTFPLIYFRYYLNRYAFMLLDILCSEASWPLWPRLTCFLLIHRGTTKTSPAKEMEESLLSFYFRRKCLPLKRAAFSSSIRATVLSTHTILQLFFFAYMSQKTANKRIKMQKGIKKNGGISDS